MIEMTVKERAFVKWVKNECKKHGVECCLRKVKYLRLEKTIKCSGYFDDGCGGGAPKLVVAVNRPDWLEILVHEYCHLTQWKSGYKLWNRAGESLHHIEKWLSGERVSRISNHLANARDLELDNEKRSVELIKKWNLDIDVDNYIRKANAYIQFYNYLRMSRKWSLPSNSPYTNKNLLSVMSNKFNMNYKKMSKRVEKIFIKENI
jgi:hypothetical protein